MFMMKVLVTISLMIHLSHVIGSSIESPIRLNKQSCNFNYTEKNTYGEGIYTVIITKVGNCFYKYKETTLKTAFNISLRGLESDKERGLDISWDTRKASTIASLSFTSSNVSHQGGPMVTKHMCLNFSVDWIRQQQYLSRLVHLRFNCVGIARGVVGDFTICVDQHQQCQRLNIDTIKCICPKTNISVTESENGDDGMTVTLVVSNSVASRDMNMVIKVTKGVDDWQVFDGSSSTNSTETLRIPTILKKPGNYTVQVTLYCLDYSNPRKQQACKTEKFYIDVKPPKAKSYPTEKQYLYVLETGCIVIVAVVVIVVIILCYKRIRQTNCTDVCRICCEYEPVQPELPLQLNNNTKCAMLSHPANDQFTDTVELQLLEELVSSNISIVYSSQHKREAISNWKDLVDDIINNCSHIIIVLSDSLLGLLELSFKENKNEIENARLENILLVRCQENVPYEILRKNTSGHSLSQAIHIVLHSCSDANRLLNRFSSFISVCNEQCVIWSPCRTPHLCGCCSYKNKTDLLQNIGVSAR